MLFAVSTDTSFFPFYCSLRCPSDARFQVRQSTSITGCVRWSVGLLFNAFVHTSHLISLLGLVYLPSLSTQFRCDALLFLRPSCGALDTEVEFNIFMRLRREKKNRKTEFQFKHVAPHCFLIEDLRQEWYHSRFFAFLCRSWVYKSRTTQC